MHRLIPLFKKPKHILKVVRFIFILAYYKISGCKTIVYNLHEDYFYDIFESIYHQLLNRPKTVIFFSYRAENKILLQYLQNKVPASQIIPNYISPFLIFDLFICAEVTGPDFPLSIFHTPKIEIYHGTGTSNLYEKKDVLNRFDSHFAIGPKFNEFIDFAYKEKSSKPHVYNIGYPKLDALLKPNPLTKDLKKLYKLDDKKTILYAPHWHEYGSIHKFKEALLEKLAEFDVNLLIKPHNYLYTRYANLNWKKRLKDFANQHENVTFVSNPNTQELYPISDLMITDTGTTAALEYSILQKPLIINYDAQWFADNDSVDIEKDLCDLGFCFENLKELKALVESVLIKPDENEILKQQTAQKNIVRKYLYQPGEATSRAVKAIYEILEN